MVTEPQQPPSSISTTTTTSSSLSSPPPLSLSPHQDSSINDNINTNKESNKNRTNDNNSNINIQTDYYDIKLYYNLHVLNGIRCLSSLLVIMFHVHYVYGGSILVRTLSCYQSVFQFIPYITMYVFRITWQMTLFWILSGFLCEYQLHQLYIKYSNNNKEQQRQPQPNAGIEMKTVEKNVDGKSDETIGLIDNHTTENKNDSKDRSNTNDHIVKIPYSQYLSFFMNRLLRLYPLYVMLPIVTYFHHQYYAGEVLRKLRLYTIYDLIKTLVFAMKWNENSPLCPSVGWTVQVDIHGYVFLLLLFSITYPHTYGGRTNPPSTSTPVWLNKRYILILLYIVSIIHVLSYRPLPEQNISKEASKSIVQYGIRGIDTSTDIQLVLYSVNQYATSRDILYPTIDFYNNFYQSIRSYRYKMIDTTYFTSIFNHGSAILLGSLLYLNLYERIKTKKQKTQNQPTNQRQEELHSLIISCSKLFIVMLGLHITRGWHSLSGIFMYFLMDVLLSMKVNHSATTTSSGTVSESSYNNFMKMILSISNFITYYVIQFLSHRMFDKLAPYTYGMYLFHMVFVMKRYEITLPQRIQAIQYATQNQIDVCQSLADHGYPYNMKFIIKETVIIFLISLLFAMILNYLIEKPIMQLRQRYLKSNVITSSNKVSDKQGKTTMKKKNI